MIKYLESVTPEQMAELKSFCEGSVFGIKALGPVLSYGLSYDFVSAWTQRDEAGHLTAFLSKYYGTITVHVSPLGDVPELLAFLRAIGFGALVGPAAVLAEAYPEGETGCVMSLSAGSACIAKGAEGELGWDDDFRHFYDVLTASNPGYVVEDYGDFLTDFSYRWTGPRWPRRPLWWSWTKPCSSAPSQRFLRRGDTTTRAPASARSVTPIRTAGHT